MLILFDNIGYRLYWVHVDGSILLMGMMNDKENENKNFDHLKIYSFFLKKIYLISKKI